MLWREVAWALQHAWCIQTWGVSCLGAQHLRWRWECWEGRGENLRADFWDLQWGFKIKGEKEEFSIQQVGGHLLYTNKIKRHSTHSLVLPVPGNYLGNWMMLGHAYLHVYRHPQCECPSHRQLDPTIQLLEKVSVSWGKHISRTNKIEQIINKN